jgi:hypothetical protein
MLPGGNVDRNCCSGNPPSPVESGYVVSMIARLAVVGIGVAALLGGGASAQATTRAPAHLGALHVASSARIPHANGTHRLVTAEASNGDVAIAVPRTATTDEIEVAKGGHKPKLFATVPHGTVAMAFSNTELFVAGRHAMSSFKRSTGAFLTTWQIRVSKDQAEGAAGSAMVYGDGVIWAVGTGESLGRQVFEIKPNSAGNLISAGSGKNVFSIAAGPRGVFFVESGGHTLVRVTAAGTGTLAKTHEKVSEMLSGPAAMQAIAVDGATLLVAHDYGQGLDAGIVRYNTKTLKHLSVAGTDIAHANLVPTVDGDLALIDTDDTVGCAHGSTEPCVERVAPATAKVTAAVEPAHGNALSAIVGPVPTVVIGAHGHAELIRLS